MKKAVIALILIAIIAIGMGIWYIQMPAAPLTPESAVEMAAKMCDKDTQNLVLLLQAINSNDERECQKTTSYLKNYCLAWFGKDDCASPLPEEQNSCQAILERNPTACEDELCHAILGNEQKCETSTCIALARRDMVGLTDPNECSAIVQKAEKDAECFQKATSPEETELCINA